MAGVPGFAVLALGSESAAFFAAIAGGVAPIEGRAGVYSAFVALFSPGRSRVGEGGLMAAETPWEPLREDIVLLMIGMGG